MLCPNESTLPRMNSTYGSRLAEALRLAGRERQELATAISVSVQAIGQVIAGKTKALTAENSAMAARFLNVDSYWLATGEGSPQYSAAAQGSPWPFASITPEQWAALSDVQRGRVEGFAEGLMREVRPVKSTPGSQAA
ncbi:hypothetical protein D3C87_518980 [compost metagenome]